MRDKSAPFRNTSYAWLPEILLILHDSMKAQWNQLSFSEKHVLQPVKIVIVGDGTNLAGGRGQCEVPPS